LERHRTVPPTACAYAGYERGTASRNPRASQRLLAFSNDCDDNPDDSNEFNFKKEKKSSEN
jgi:hypothetical protein